MNSPLPRILGLSLALGLVAATNASALVVAENTSTTNVGQAQFYGQSFTVVGGGSFTNIVANFFSDSPATTPLAAGTGFLLSTEYTGTPGSLSSATPGYLGQAVASGGFYDFGSSVTLVSGTQYFLLSNTAMAASGSGVDVYAGGNAYYGGSSFDSRITQDAAFRISGTATPDSGTTASLLGLALFGLFALRRKLS